MKNLIFVIALILISVSCSDNKKGKEMTSYEKAMLFKKNNPIGEKLGFGDVILDSVIIYGDDKVDSLRICLLHSNMNDVGAFTCSAIVNWKNGELIDGLRISIYNYCNDNGEKVIVGRPTMDLYDNRYWVAFRDCRNDEQMQIMSDVLASNKTFPQQSDEVTTLNSLKYSPSTGDYIFHYTLSGSADNAAHDYKKISTKIRKGTIQQLKLLMENSKEIHDFYKMLERQDVLIKYEYYSASTAKLLFSFSMTPGQLLKH